MTGGCPEFAEYCCYFLYLVPVESLPPVVMLEEGVDGPTSSLAVLFDRAVLLPREEEEEGSR